VSLELPLWVHHGTQGLNRPGRRQIEAQARQGDPATRPQLLARPGKQGDRLVVLSHTCDLIKAPESFPAFEVGLAVTTRSTTVITDSQNLGSAQYYLLDWGSEDSARVLDFRWRAQLDKGFLVEHPPDNTVVDGWDRGKVERFSRWLGRRYGRPVLSDEDVRDVSDPVRYAWRKLAEDEPQLAREASSHFIEFRFKRLDAGVEIYVLSPDDHPDSGLALEVFGVLTDALAPLHGTVVTRTDKISYATFTRDDDLNTEAIDLDWASDDETDEAATPRPPV
jgi:hypothetical protein